jgi:hypothetical protein
MGRREERRRKKEEGGREKSDDRRQKSDDNVRDGRQEAGEGRPEKSEDRGQRSGVGDRTFDRRGHGWLEGLILLASRYPLLAPLMAASAPFVRFCE